VMPQTSSGRWVLHVLQVPSMNRVCLQQALLPFCAFYSSFLIGAYRAAVRGARHLVCGRLGFACKLDR
jgi:hypothetical protein